MREESACQTAPEPGEARAAGECEAPRKDETGNPCMISLRDSNLLGGFANLLDRIANLLESEISASL